MSNYPCPSLPPFIVQFCDDKFVNAHSTVGGTVGQGVMQLPFLFCRSLELFWPVLWPFTNVKRTSMKLSDLNKAHCT